VIRAVQPTRQPGVHPIFQVALSLEPKITVAGEWTWNHHEVFNGCSKFDLWFQLEQRFEGIVGHIEYKTAIVDSDLVRRMAGHFRVLADAVVKDAGCPLGRLPLLTQSEWDEFSRWNGRRRPCDGPNLANQLFEEQARKTPSAPGILFGQRALTY
jgi:non-ribosomal peptide synthetase component F